MIKRITAAVTALVLLFLLASCGGQGEENTNGSQTLGTSSVSTDNKNDSTVGDTNSSHEPSSSEHDKNEVKPTQTSSSTIAAQTVKVTIPEGYTLVRTALMLEKKGVCSYDAFIKAAQNYALSSNSVLADVANAKNVFLKLEGYFFPATYDFKLNSDPNAVIAKMVATMSAKITSAVRARASELGYSVHEILTIASIIEKEAVTADQRTLISSVLHNRLKQKKQLQCDVTINYCNGVIKAYFPDKLETYKYYYNTYRCAALPAGPICNPGMAAINAALYPENTNYLYFVIKGSESAFAATYKEHQENCKKLGFN